MAFITAPVFGIKQIKWKLNRPAQINIGAYTGVRQAVTNPWFGQWSASVTLAQQQSDATFAATRAWIASCQGSLNVFRLYATTEPQNSNVGVILSANAAQGATSASITGYTTAVHAGQYITINGQLLLLTNGGSSISFIPPLRQAAPSGTPVVTSQPYALVYLANPQQEWDISPGRLFDMSFDVIEAINETDGVAPEQLWTPAQLFTGQAGAWYDPSDLTTLFQDTAGTVPVTTAGQSVALMKDKSGNGNDLVQATAANQPTYQVDGSGNSYLLFDGSNDYLAKSSFTITLPYDRLTAMQQVTWTINHYVWAALSQSIGLIQNNVTPLLRLETGTTTNSLQNSGAAIGSNAVVTERHVAAASLLAVNNGSYSGPTDAGSSAPTSLYLGSNTASASNIRFYGGVIRATQLSSGDMASTRTWLGNKCGLSL